MEKKLLVREDVIRLRQLKREVDTIIKECRDALLNHYMIIPRGDLKHRYGKIRSITIDRDNFEILALFDVCDAKLCDGSVVSEVHGCEYYIPICKEEDLDEWKLTIQSEPPSPKQIKDAFNKWKSTKKK